MQPKYDFVITFVLCS